MAGAIQTLPAEVSAQYAPESLAGKTFPDLQGFLERLDILKRHSNPTELEELSARVYDTIADRAMQSRPPSFVNISANCWANAILQAVFNDPVLLKRVLKSNTTDLQGVKTLVWQTLFALDRVHVLGDDLFNSQQVRMYAGFSGCEGVDLNPGQHLDVAPAFETLLADLAIATPLERSQEYEDDPSLSRELCDSIEPMISLEMGNAPFETLFNRLFETTIDHPTDRDQNGILRMRFRNAPETLEIKAQRAQYDQASNQLYKDSTPLQEVPPCLQVAGEHIVDPNILGASYELSSVIIHLGEGLSFGHYVTLLSKPDGYYLANDAKVYQWNPIEEQWIYLNEEEEETYATLPSGAITIEPGLLAFVGSEGYEFDGNVWRKSDAHNEELLAKSPEQLMGDGYVFNYRKREVVRRRAPPAYEAPPLPAYEPRPAPPAYEEPVRPSRCCDLTKAVGGLAWSSLKFVGWVLSTPVTYTWGTVFPAKRKVD